MNRQGRRRLARHDATETAFLNRRRQVILRARMVARLKHSTDALPFSSKFSHCGARRLSFILALFVENELSLTPAGKMTRSYERRHAIFFRARKLRLLSDYFVGRRDERGAILIANTIRISRCL